MNSMDDGIDLVDRIAQDLPLEVRAAYYRELNHCRSLPENDELLRVLRAMQFLTLLMRDVPERVGAERERLQKLLQGAMETLAKFTATADDHRSVIEKRLATLPEEVAQGLRRDPESGFRELDRIGCIREVPWDQRAAFVADAWHRAIAGADATKRSVLVVCATHNEIATVTDAIRAKRREAGDLGESRAVTQDVGLGWTAAQKLEWRNYRAGLVLAFHREVKGISRNATAAFLHADATGVVVQCPDGQRRKITRKQAQSFDVMERRALDIAVGDPVLLTANRRHPGFQATNGEIATVERIDARGRIGLSDGRIVPEDYTHIAHGYAITAHRSQGKSVDEVILSAAGMSRELFYVAASRGRQRVTVVTSDSERLRESVGRSGTRQSATELARKAIMKLHFGIRRGFVAACEMIRRARLHPAVRVDKSVPKERGQREHGLGR